MSNEELAKKAIDLAIAFYGKKSGIKTELLLKCAEVCQMVEIVEKLKEYNAKLGEIVEALRSIDVRLAGKR